MLQKIASVIGGNVKISNQNILWVENNQKKIKNILTIFDTYPLLTSSKQCQLNFMKKCLEFKDIKWYLENRNLKYKLQFNIINEMSNKNILILPYFKEWLSGFMEAESCFSIRKNSNHSFSIGQKNDYYLILNIKNYFGSENKINFREKDNFYNLEIYKKNILKGIISHCYHYPLLGEKSISLQKFIYVIN